MTFIPVLIIDSIDTYIVIILLYDVSFSIEWLQGY